MFKRSFKGLMVFIICISLLFVFATGCDNQDTTNGNDVDKNETTDNGEQGNGEDTGKGGEPVNLDLYFMKATDNTFELESETREFEEPIELEVLAEALLDGPETDELTRVIPEDTILRDVYLEDGVAYLDFSKEITEANLGSEAETVLVDSIVKSFTQLEEVEAVQIKVEGEVIESIAGHITIDEPLQ